MSSRTQVWKVWRCQCVPTTKSGDIPAASIYGDSKPQNFQAVCRVLKHHYWKMETPLHHKWWFKSLSCWLFQTPLVVNRKSNANTSNGDLSSHYIVEFRVTKIGCSWYIPTFGDWGRKKFCSVQQRSATALPVIFCWKLNFISQLHYR